MKSTGMIFGVAALLGATFAAGDASADAGAVYHRIKDKENLLGPVPPEVAETVLGTIDCDTGAFTLGEFPSTHSSSFNQALANQGIDITSEVQTYEVGAFAKRVHMHAQATNRRGRPLSLSVVFNPSVSPSQTANADDVSVEIGESTGNFTFKVKCGDRTSSGPVPFANGQLWPPSPTTQAQTISSIRYDHQATRADGGAFIVEAFPVAVLYEPPVDSQKKNYAEYLDRTVVGSDTSFAYSTAQTNTHPIAPPMADEDQLAGTAKTAGAGLIATGNPYAAAAGAVLEVIASGLGSTTATTDAGSSSVTSNGLRTRMSSSVQLKTGTGADLRGPGDGDYIWYRHNAYFTWVATDGGESKIRASFLGSELLESRQVYQLKADLAALRAAPRPDPSALGASSHLTAATIESLLRLDPFAASGAPSLPASRFYDVTPSATHGSDHVGPGWSDTLGITTEQIAGGSTSSFTTNTTQFSKGWLSFLGLGITEDKTLTATVGLSRTQDSYRVSSQVVKVVLTADSRDHYCTKIYFDKLFGTFAFKQQLSCN